MSKNNRNMINIAYDNKIITKNPITGELAPIGMTL